MASSIQWGPRLSFSQLPLDLDLDPVGNGRKRPHSPTDEHMSQQWPLKLPLASQNVVRADFGLFMQPNARVAKVTRNRLVASNIVPVENGAVHPSEYTQRKALRATPGLTQNPRLSLAHPDYGLPQTLIVNLGELGIHSIYPWQSSCLLKSDILLGQRNIVYEAPTGGGKSLVADILMIKRILEHPTKKAILVLPYIATVQEKLLWLRRLVKGMTRNSAPMSSASQNARSKYSTVLQDDKIRVTGFFGGGMARASWEDTDIAVCTIEKANSLINSMIVDEALADIGVLVLDELHMVNDAGRGHFLEMMTTKLLCLRCEVQIIGLSATFAEVEVVAKWLADAYYFKTSYRPIPIQEFFVPGRSVYPLSSLGSVLKSDGKRTPARDLGASNIPEPLKRVEKSVHKEFSNETLDSVVALVNENVRSGYGSLVFCGSRKKAERLAAIVSEVLPTSDEILPEELEARRELLQSLQESTSGYEEMFDDTILKGVGIHHAGLTFEERSLIAEAFDSRVLRVVVATASLAAGVNLPARRVIIYGTKMGRDVVGPAMLRQMRGRAGRKGKDEVGETFLCFEWKDCQEALELLEAELPELTSAFSPEKEGLSRALLEIIATKLATDLNAIHVYANCSLLAITTPVENLPSRITSSLDELVKLGHIEDVGFEGPNITYTATQMGEATVAALLSPADGLAVFEDCKKARTAFALDDDLQVFYLFTPLQTSELSVQQWGVLMAEIDKLQESGLRALGNLGVLPAVISRYSQTGPPPNPTLAEEQKLRIHHRLFTALQLRDLCNEQPVYKVAKKYLIERGQVQDLAKNCHSFAWGVIKFCEKMGWSMLQAVLQHMSNRLITGSRADLLELGQIAYVKSMTARIFWDSGLKSVWQVAAADPADLVPLLLQAQPKKFKLKEGDEERRIMKLEKKAEIIVRDANRIWALIQKACRQTMPLFESGVRD